MPTFFINTEDARISNAFLATLGAAPGATYLAQIKAFGLVNSVNAMIAATGKTTAADLATTITGNLGLTGAAATAGQAYLTSVTLAGASSTWAANLISTLDLFTTLQNDAVYGTAASNYVSRINAAVSYSSVAANNTTDLTTLAAAVGSAGSTAAAGSIFTLTTNADVLNPTSATAANKTTAGDDVIYGLSDGMLTSSDVIDGGAGNDTINGAATAAGQTIAPVLASVETLTITQTAANTKALTISAANATGLTTLNIKDAGAVGAAYTGAASDEVITVTGLNRAATLGIIGGTSGTYDAGGTGTASQINATFTGAVAADTQKVAISSKGQTGDLILATAETIEITATGTGTTGANTIGLLTNTAAKNLNIKGTGDLTISATNFAGTSTVLVTVDASTSSGIISYAGENGAKHKFTGGSGRTTVTLSGAADDTVTTGASRDVITIGTGSDTVTAGDGDDRVVVGGQTDISALDSVDGGGGNDVIVVTNATLDTATRTELAKGSKNFEAVESTAATLVTINFQQLSTYDTAWVTAAMAAADNGTVDTAGTNSISATTENGDTLVISASRAGQDGGKAATKATAAGTAKSGGDGINLTPFLDNGSNAATVRIIGNSDFAGGAGETGLGGAATDIGGTGGDAFDASSHETINLVIVGTQAATGTADTVTFTAGAAGPDGGKTAGAAGNSFVVGTNATINLTSELDPYSTTAAKHNHIDFGTIKGTNVTLNGSTFKGNITVTAGDGNVTLNTGEGSDTVTGGTGADTISTGAGVDSISNRATGGSATAADVITTGAGFDTVTLIGSAASAANYSAASRITDFTVGDRADNTDLIRLSSANTDYSAGLSVDGTAQGASGSVGVQTLAQNGTVDAGTTNTVEFFKLTTGVAFTTSLQATFNAAIGTGTVTNLTNAVYAGSFYDTTNSVMVLFEVATASTTNSTLETGDTVRLIGTINMTAADYALIDTDNFANFL